MEALTRRSLAFDAVGLVKFEVFNQWINWMFQMVRQQPPPGFSKPTLAQLLRADRQAFVRLQEQSREGIKPHADGTRPLDNLIKNLTNDHTVTLHKPQSRSPATRTSRAGTNSTNGRMTNGANDKCGSRTSTSLLEVDRRAMERTGVNYPKLSRDVPAPLPPQKGFASHSTSTAATSANQEKPVIVANTFALSRNCHGNHSKAGL